MPNARVGNRQKVCSRPECQKERHKRACKAWHKKNPNYDKEERLRTRLLDDKSNRENLKTSTPMSKVNEQTARDVVGIEVFVFVDEILKHLVDWIRDIVPPQPTEKKREIYQVPAKEERDEIAQTCRSP